MEVQKAGDNSQQIQIKNLTIGIDEKRAREIYDEKYNIAKNSFTEEALKIANERVKELEDRLIPKMEAIDNGLKAFADPSFQLLLVEAQKSAAATEREVDYDLLSELLVHRIERGSDRHVRTGVHRAVEIVEDISDESLLALTVVHSVNSFVPTLPDVNQALDILNDLFGKIMYSELPKSNDWIEHLDILDAVRINQFGKFKSIEYIYTTKLNGIAVVGIKRDSEEHNRAKVILQENGLNFDSILVENVLNPDFVRIKISNIEEVENLGIIHSTNGENIVIPFSDAQKQAVRSVIELYSKDSNLINEMKRVFMNEWMKRSNLNKLELWWEGLPSYSFHITSVGKVLAHANAQRCEKRLPPLKW